MNDQVTTPLTFEQKMRARIKEGIGDLMSDEDLSKLIQASLAEIFTKPRPNPKYSSYGSGNRESMHLEPFLHEILREALQPTVDKLVQQYITDNPELIITHLNTVFQEGIGKAVLLSMVNLFKNDLFTLQMNLESSIRTGTLRPS